MRGVNIVGGKGWKDVCNRRVGGIYIRMRVKESGKVQVT